VSSRRLRASTFASFHLLAPAAVSASPHSAARTPFTLLAAIETPVPVWQKTTPASARALATAWATSSEALAQLAVGSRTASWPRSRIFATT
jgi:hypothetical protein